MSSEQISLKSFVEEIHSATYGTHPRKFCFVLGAGASRTSGIKSGQELVKIWDKELREQNEEAYTRWRDELKITDSNMSSHYGNYYEKRFSRCPADGLNYIESIMKSAHPSAGYVMLAFILSNTPHKIVVTTNFDHLTEDAVRYYAHEIPLVIGHESLTHYVTSHPVRPTVVKIHHDLLFDPKNRFEDLQTLSENWSCVLERIFENFHPVFIGYAGNDKNLMDFLISHSEHFASNRWKYPYWLLYKTDPFDGSVKEFMDGCHGMIVRHDGFDEVMLRLGASFGYRIPTEAEFLVDAKQRFTSLKDAIDILSDKANPNTVVECSIANAFIGSNDVHKALDQIACESEAQKMYHTATRYIHIGMYKEAQDILKQLTALEPDNLRYRYKYAETFYSLNDYVSGLAAAEELAVSSPDTYYPYFMQGKFLQKLNQTDAALSAYQKAVKINSDMVQAHYCIAEILEEKGEKIEAMFAYRKAIDCDPDWNMPYYGIGSILKEMGQLHDALSAFLICASINPLWEMVHFELGTTYEALQRYEDALTAYQTARMLDLNCPVFHYKVAEMMNILKRYEEARYEMEIAVSSNPGELYFYDCLATALHGLNREEEAKAVEEQALALFSAAEAAEKNM